MKNDYIGKACNQIDAGMFSGDAFFDPKAREELREWMARWERGLKEFDETFPNGEEDDSLIEEEG